MSQIGTTGSANWDIAQASRANGCVALSQFGPSWNGVRIVHPFMAMEINAPLTFGVALDVDQSQTLKFCKSDAHSLAVNP